MTDLERARAHLLYQQQQLASVRILRLDAKTHEVFENCLLAALSWVWEEQEKEEVRRFMKAPIDPRGYIDFGGRAFFDKRGNRV